MRERVILIVFLKGGKRQIFFFFLMRERVILFIVFLKGEKREKVFFFNERKSFDHFFLRGEKRGGVILEIGRLFLKRRREIKELDVEMGNMVFKCEIKE